MVLTEMASFPVILRQDRGLCAQNFAGNCNFSDFLQDLSCKTIDKQGKLWYIIKVQSIVLKLFLQDILQKNCYDIIKLFRS